jgi:hypothetical protein
MLRCLTWRFPPATTTWCGTEQISTFKFSTFSDGSLFPDTFACAHHTVMAVTNLHLAAFERAPRYLPAGDFIWRPSGSRPRLPMSA